MTRRDALVALASVLAGCNRTRGNRPRVAFVLKTFNSPFFLDMRKGAEAAAARAGIDLIVQAAEREIDVERQMQIIENLIETRVAVLCLCPSGSKEIVPAVGKANRAGIPVIIVDDEIDESAAARTGRVVRHLHRLGQRRRRPHRGPVSGRARAADRPGSRSSKAFPATRPATRACGDFATPSDLPRHRCRRVADGELGARPGLLGVPEHAAGAPGHRRAVCLQRHDGAGRGRGDPGGRPDRPDPRHRLRRGRRCA